MKITLNNWKINPSPYAGLSTAVNCDTRAVSGEIKAKIKLENLSYFKEDTEITDFTILASALDQFGNTYAVCDNADVVYFPYYSDQAVYAFNIQSGLNNWSYVMTPDSVVFLDYVENGWFQFTFYPNGGGSRALNFNSSGLSSSWFFGADVIVNATFKSQIDDILYFGGYDTVLDKNVLGSLEAQTNFDPTNSGTFNINYNALDFDGGRTPEINAINEYGEFLVIARGNRLYTWDRNELFFENQITVSGGDIKVLAKLNNNLYAITNGDGRVYQTNGSSVVYVTKLYDYIRTIEGTVNGPSSAGGGSSSATEQVVTIAQNSHFTDNDKIYIGVNMYRDIDGSSYYYPYGIWSISTSGEVEYESTIGSGDYRAFYDVDTLVLFPKVKHIFKTFNDSYVFAGYTQDFSFNKTKYTSVYDESLNGWTDYKTFFETPGYVIGSPKSPATPQPLEFILGKNLQ